jgi:hypothetical protein
MVFPCEGWDWIGWGEGGVGGESIAMGEGPDPFTSRESGCVPSRSIAGSFVNDTSGSGDDVCAA